MTSVPPFCFVAVSRTFLGVTPRIGEPPAAAEDGARAGVYDRGELQDPQRVYRLPPFALARSIADALFQSAFYMIAAHLHSSLEAEEEGLWEDLQQLTAAYAQATLVQWSPLLEAQRLLSASLARCVRQK